MNNELDFTGVKLIVIYLGDTCNFNCTYCDRDYIKFDVGSQNLRKSDFSEIINFIKDASTNAKDLDYVSFHGGEPLLYVNQINLILEEISASLLVNDIRWGMTTNGSLIPENKWFFEKWGYNLTVSLSYDFNFQELNRNIIDFDEISKILIESKTHSLLQFVVPTNIEKSFSINTVASIINDCQKLHCDTVNIIPLRHLRGQRKYKVVLDDINMDWFSINFMRFIQSLYVNGINVYIDGNYDGIDKHYLNNHGKLILSPDGYIYPEFDFLEYKRPEFRIGKWKNNPELIRVQQEDDKLLSGCVSCEMKKNCGLKYLNKLFNQAPSGQCRKFYRIIELMVLHLYKLKRKPSLLHWIGYE